MTSNFGLPDLSLDKHKIDMKDRQDIKKSEINNAKEKIDAKLSDKKLSDDEIKAITQMYEQESTEGGIKEIKEYIDKLLINSTAQGILKLKQEIENINPHNGFKDLTESFDDDTVGKKLLENFGSAIDGILGNEFSVKEKDNIKLAFIDMTFDLSKDLIKEFKSGEKITIKDIQDGMKFLKSKKLEVDNIVKGSGGELNKLKKAQTILGTSNNPFVKKMQKLVDKMIKNFEKLEEIKKQKKEKGKDFSKINDVYDSFGIKGHEDHNDKEIFNSVKDKTHKVFDLADKFDKIVQLKTKAKNKPDVAAVKKAAEKLGINDKDKKEQSNFLKELFPGDGLFSQLMRLFFAIALGIDDNGVFPENNDDSKSVNNLREAVKKNKNILNGKVTVEQIKKLDPKKLKKFYELMKSENIDTTNDDFWQKLLTGKGLKKTDKLFKLYQNLVGKNGKILDTNEGLDELVKKLNNLKLSGNKESQKTKSPKKTKVKK